MSNYTSAFLPRVSHDLIDRINSSYTQDWIQKMGRKLKDVDSNLFDLYQEVSELKYPSYFKTNFLFMYGLLDESSRLISTADFDSKNFTPSGLIKIEDNFIDNLFGKDRKKLIHTSIDYKGILAEENPVILNFIDSRLLEVEFNDSKKHSIIEGLAGSSLCYFTLHNQGLKLAKNLGDLGNYYSQSKRLS